jgi:predicted nucleotidyltransferase
MPSIDLNDPIAVLLAASNALEQANIEAAAYGGLALAVYGEARETRDADLAVAGLETRQAETALRTAGFEVILAFDRMQFGGQLVSRLTLFGEGATNTVDLVEPRSEGYARRVLERAVLGELRGNQIRVVAPEDFVILKILATRDRDLEDATSVMRSIGSALDREVIREEVRLLASEIIDYGIDDRWRRAQATA